MQGIGFRNKLVLGLGLRLELGFGTSIVIRVSDYGLELGLRFGIRLN